VPEGSSTLLSIERSDSAKFLHFCIRNALDAAADFYALAKIADDGDVEKIENINRPLV